MPLLRLVGTVAKDTLVMNLHNLGNILRHGICFLPKYFSFNLHECVILTCAPLDLFDNENVVPTVLPVSLKYHFHNRMLLIKAHNLRCGGE